VPRREMLLLSASTLMSPGSASAQGNSVKEAYDTYADTYDQMDGGGYADAFGLPDLRSELLQKAYGRVLEVGVGTGLNLPLYNLSSLESLEAVDLSRGMLQQAESKARTLGAAEIIHFQQANAEQLPFEDNYFDCVVDTFSLCVYTDPKQALSEMRRVTRPGGKVLLLAHSRSNIGPLAMYQDITSSAVANMGKGCVWNQDIPALLSAAGLELVSEQRHLAGLLSLVVASPRTS